ncbi:flagellar hook-associated protein 2 [Shewanella sairae]|uniref:Flagellar hook-associated protein 2 n=1 Tax=Shewanella sairae TaxID=190310 RepID=A0ABQ4PPR8_9GAMM|nr:flagellar filament capping protein FliD [Shewanella sairae]MCL1129238.1 flagellar filament capping protein FliD [Shewanella sairae]GIU50852.1 flagellar hook-associated protein 2 [Shewanella sairae]
MALTATGIGSGLDINTIVKVLVDAEKVPKEAIFDKTEATIEAKVSAIGTLKSQLSTFQDALEKLSDPESLNIRKVSTGDSSYFTASADKNAQSGSYQVQVEQLAQQHKVAGGNVADASAAVGQGKLDLSVNGKAFSVDVEAGDSLEAIAKKVNESADNSGVTATIIKSDGGSRLVFSSDETGTDNQVSVTATDTVGSGLNDMFGAGKLETLQEAKNAIVHIDGQKVTAQSNEIENAITGVTLSLTDADVGKTSTLKVEQDNEAVKENVKGFVDAYNTLVESISSLSKYDSEKEESAALQGDSMIRSIESQMRNMISSRVDVDGETIALYDIGIETDRYGKMSINDEKLDKVIAEDMGSLEGLFTTPDTGIATSLDNLVEGYVKSGGLIDSRDNALTNDQKRLDEQRESFSLKMEMLQARLFKQFNAMDLVVGQLNQQSAGLVDRLNSLPGVVGS